MQRMLRRDCLVLVVTSILLAFLSRLGAAVPPQALQQGTRDGIGVFGLVNNSLNLTYDELRSFPMVSEVAELKCVYGSPDVTYNWTGIPLFYLLTLAQVKPEAYKVVTRGSDGFSSDLLIEDALKPTTILALGANGTDLPEINGIEGLYRLVVPCKWGYKWVGYVTEIEVVDYDYKGTYESSGFSDEADRPDSTVLPPITPPMQELNLAFGNTTFNVEAFTNVSIIDCALDYAQKKISLNITVPSGTVGFADFILQQTFLKGPYNVSVDTQAVNTIETDLTNQSYLYVTFPDGLHNVEITGTSARTLTSLTCSRTVVGQGYDFNINVGVANFGNYQEMFNLTVYATVFIVQQNVTLQIASQNVTLESGNYANITFVVNTAGYSYGNYTISAYAWPVPSETDTGNNNCTCSNSVHVGVPGDVSGTIPRVYDEVDNMKDIAYLVSLFNTRPSSPNWQSNADVNNDGVCNMKDIAIAVYHFNNHE